MASLGAPANGAYTQAELSKLTVTQLKAICKERKISGYSKLGKQALVQKLVEAGLCSSTVGAILSVSTEISKAAPEPCGTPISSSFAYKTKVSTTPPGETFDGHSPPTLNAVGNLISTTPHLAVDVSTLAVVSDSVSKAPARLNGASGKSSSSASLKSPLQPPHDGVGPDTPAAPAEKAKKRTRPIVGSMLPPPPIKRPRILSPSTTPNVQKQPRGASSGAGSVVPAKLSLKVLPGNVTGPLVGVVSSGLELTSAPVKRFKPLVVNKAKLLASSAARQPASSSQSPSTAISSVSIAFTPTPQLAEVSLKSLENIVAPVPPLRSISMPPTLSQRKRVQSWAVILSGLCDKERGVCVLVSRAFRYAVYLSASTILIQDYSGRRLQEDVLQRYSLAMTDMWPYLRAREREVIERRSVYERSVVARIFQRSGLSHPITPRFWASPDSTKQLLIAIRFCLTRAWFELSVRSSRGGRDDAESWLRGTVTDAREVVRGEIWAVAVYFPASATRPARQEMFHVLEATCEVVGRPPHSGVESGKLPVDVLVRADWSAYIARRTAPRSEEGALLSHLRWTGMEDYECGMSKLWLKRIESEGMEGAEKRTVAERYVLACVVGNSISGEWRTTNEMAQEFAGLPERVAQPLRTKTAPLNLYLPEHHLVESVHFASTRGEALHPAVAVVQTPHREYLILRDNGMQVGCEEEGVASVWQEVLRCDPRGLPRS